MIELAYFTTEPETCPYLHDRPSRQRVGVVARLSGTEYDRLLAEGWRRFGSVIFRPSCGSCRECVPIRVLVSRFQPSKSQRRVLRRNRDVELEIGRPRVDVERIDLYRRFHAERARSRGWPYRDMSPAEYLETFVDNAAPTLELRYRLEGRLIAVAYVGEGDESLNSIYAFSDPELSRRSLGTLDVLREIELARSRGKQYLYLGYLVEGCVSMAYKVRFRPHQLLRGGHWRLGSEAGNPRRSDAEEVSARSRATGTDGRQASVPAGRGPRRSGPGGRDA